MRAVIRPCGSTRQRRLTPSLALALLTGCCALAAVSPAALGAHSRYGRLIARGKLDPLATPKASFHGLRPAPVYWLVVTNAAAEQLDITWSLSCSNPARKASGGASGEATIAHGRWVKRVRADWIKHPAYCSGRVEGAVASSSLKISVYAE